VGLAYGSSTWLALRMLKRKLAEPAAWATVIKNKHLPRNQNTAFRAGSVSDGWKTKHKHSHGRTRNFTESKHTHIFQSRKRKRRFDHPFLRNESSLKKHKPRIFTAKTLSSLRSSRKVRISCLPLRLCGENAFKRQRTSSHQCPLIC
jgi:hypothetical protein